MPRSCTEGGSRAIGPTLQRQLDLFLKSSSRCCVAPASLASPSRATSEHGKRDPTLQPDLHLTPELTSRCCMGAKVTLRWHKHVPTLLFTLPWFNPLPPLKEIHSPKPGKVNREAGLVRGKRWEGGISYSPCPGLTPSRPLKKLTHPSKARCIGRRSWLGGKEKERGGGEEEEAP